MKRILLSLLLVAVGAAAALFAVSRMPDVAARLFPQEPDVRSIAQSSLAAVRQQHRMTTLVARFTVAVTSTRSRLGLTAKKTMIVPGLVRYELDWAKLDPEAIGWDPAGRVLTVDVPELQLAEPQADLGRIQEYQSGALLMSLTDAETELDAANRREVTRSLAAEARSPILLGLARDATRAAVERTFLLPLQAVGVEARVVVRFPDETGAAM